MTDAARARAPEPRCCRGCSPPAAAAAEAAAGLVAAASERVAARVSSAGRISNAALEADQFAAHGLAWMATYAESLREMRRLGRAASTPPAGFGEIEQLILQIGFGEYLAQLAGGIPMSQLEIVRPARRRPRRRGARRLPHPGGRGADRRRQQRRRPRAASSR